MSGDGIRHKPVGYIGGIVRQYNEKQEISWRSPKSDIDAPHTDRRHNSPTAKLMPALTTTAGAICRTTSNTSKGTARVLH